MLTPPYTLHMPTSLDEALDKAREIMQAGEDFDWVAGGTDLLPNYKWHLNVKPHVISLARVPELTELSPTHIGAMVRLHDLTIGDSTHDLVRQAASSIASVMIRRSGTVGGNICLDTRCFWFNQTEEWRRSIDWCYKCDCGTEADCRVIPNQNTLCVATYQADLAPALICLDSTIHLASPNGTRSMPLAEFFQHDGITRNVLEAGEIVTHVELPDDADEWVGRYQKLALREAWDFPEAGVAAAWKVNGAGLEGLRISTTGLETTPGDHSDIASEAIEGWSGEQSVKALAEQVRTAIKPVYNTYFTAPYRRKMIRVLARRALSPLTKL